MSSGRFSKVMLGACFASVAVIALQKNNAEMLAADLSDAEKDLKEAEKALKDEKARHAEDNRLRHAEKAIETVLATYPLTDKHGQLCWLLPAGDHARAATAVKNKNATSCQEGDLSISFVTGNWMRDPVASGFACVAKDGRPHLIDAYMADQIALNSVCTRSFVSQENGLLAPK